MQNGLAKGLNQGPKSGSRDLRKSSDGISSIFSIHVYMKLHDYSERGFVPNPKSIFLIKLFSLLKERETATRKLLLN